MPIILGIAKNGGLSFTSGVKPPLSLAKTIMVFSSSFLSSKAITISPIALSISSTIAA